MRLPERTGWVTIMAVRPLPLKSAAGAMAPPSEGASHKATGAATQIDISTTLRRRL